MNKKKWKNSKYCLKIPPCPAYDIEGIEHWLEEMAETGFLLKKDSYALGAATFEKSKPCFMRYRLDTALKNDDPDESGYEYVSSYGQFNIYRSADIREYGSAASSEVQALAINGGKSKYNAAFTLIFFPIIWPLLAIKGNILLVMINSGIGVIHLLKPGQYRLVNTGAAFHLLP